MHRVVYRSKRSHCLTNYASRRTGTIFSTLWSRNFNRNAPFAQNRNIQIFCLRRNFLFYSWTLCLSCKNRFVYTLRQGMRDWINSAFVGNRCLFRVNVLRTVWLRLFGENYLLYRKVVQLLAQSGWLKRGCRLVPSKILIFKTTGTSILWRGCSTRFHLLLLIIKF